MNRENEFYVDANQDQPLVKPEEPLELSEELVSKAEEYDKERAAVAYLTKDLESGPLESREARPSVSLHDPSEYEEAMEELGEGVWMMYFWNDEECSCPVGYHNLAPAWSTDEVYEIGSAEIGNREAVKNNMDLVSEAWKYALDQKSGEEGSLEFTGWMLGDAEWSFDLSREDASEIGDTLSEGYPLSIEAIGLASDGSISAGYLHLFEEGGPTTGYGTSADMTPNVDKSQLDIETLIKIKAADEEVEDTVLDSLAVEGGQVKYPSTEATENLRTVMSHAGVDLNKRNEESLAEDNTEKMKEFLS